MTINEKLAARLLRITNIGGVRGTLDVPLGDITYLDGDNGLGKSSTINGLAALCGAPVSDLLTQGEEEGEVYLELTDGTWFRRRITATGTNQLTAGHPEQGTIGRAASWLRATLSAAALSPAEFLDADDAEAGEYLLRTTPLTVTAEEIADAVGDDIESDTLISFDGHALTVIDRAIKALYDERTGENRTARDARTTAEQLQKSIPEDAADPDLLGTTLGGLREKLREILEAREAAEKEAAHTARSESDAELEAIGVETTKRSASRVGLQAELRRIQDAIAAEDLALDELEQRRRSVMTARDERAEAAERAAGTPFQEREASVRERIAQAQQARDAALKLASSISNTRDMIAQNTERAEAAHVRSHRLTEAMARLDALKAAKAAALPVEGVSIQDGRLHVGGVPWSRVNTADKIRVAFAASTAQEARIRFVFADDLEHLSTRTRREVEAYCREHGVQVLGARVTDDEELTVRSGDPAPAGLES